MPVGARTAEEAAAAVGCDVAQICKSLVFRLDGEPPSPLLVVTSGANRVDEDAVAAVVGTRPAKADAAFARDQTGYAIGGVPPFAHARPVQTLVDEDLLRFEVVWAAAGSPTAVFPIAPGRLVALCRGRVARVAA